MWHGRLGRATIGTNARLLKRAKARRLPQTWFEQTDCPFTPTKE